MWGSAGGGWGREGRPSLLSPTEQPIASGAQIRGLRHNKSRDSTVGWGEVTVSGPLGFFSSLPRAVFFYFLCHSFSCPLSISLSGLALPSSPFFLPVPPSQSPLLLVLGDHKWIFCLVLSMRGQPPFLHPVNKILNNRNRNTLADLPMDTHTHSSQANTCACAQTPTHAHTRAYSHIFSSLPPLILSFFHLEFNVVFCVFSTLPLHFPSIYSSCENLFPISSVTPADR